jgi:hypothetical protein
MLDSLLFLKFNAQLFNFYRAQDSAHIYSSLYFVWSSHDESDPVIQDNFFRTQWWLDLHRMWVHETAAEDDSDDELPNISF